jgi:hypothetical protein
MGFVGGSSSIVAGAETGSASVSGTGAAAREDAGFGECSTAGSGADSDDSEASGAGGTSIAGSFEARVLAAFGFEAFLVLTLGIIFNF